MRKEYRRAIKKGKWIKISLVAYLIFSILFLCKKTDNVYAKEVSEIKNISIVFDNSSSMFRNDSDKKYTTRWIEADYAVRALRDMMGAEDKFKIYFIGDEGKKSYSDVAQGMSEMKFHEGTPFDVVKKAVNELNFSGSINSSENWVIILTDGEFTKGMETDSLEQELKSILVGKNISIFYIPIGNGTVIEESPKDRIFTIDGESDDITEQILEAIKKIYNKEQIVSDDGKGVYIENGKCYIDLEVPLEELSVFVQEIGEEQLYKDWKTENEQNISDQAASMNNEDISYPNYLMLESTKQVKGRDNIPPKEPEVLNYNTNKIKYKTLNGTIYQFQKRAEAASNEYAERIEIPIGNNVTKVVVYYQPDVDFKFTYTQDGKKVIPWENKDIQDMESSNLDSQGFIREGTLELKMECIDSLGTALESSLLSIDRFTISYQKDNQEEKVIEKSVSSDVFSMEVSEGKYTLHITTPWHTKENCELEVLEGKKEISMRVAGQQAINAEGKGEIHLEILEEGVAVTDKEEVSIMVDCDVEEIEIEEPIAYLGDGKWLINYYFDKKAELPEDEVIFRICVSHDYNGEIQKKEEEFYIQLSEEIFEIKAEQTPILTECGWTQMFPFIEEKIPLKYIKVTETGEKIPLANNEYDWLEFSLENVDSEKAREYILIDEKGNLKLKGDSSWGDFERQNVNIKIKYIYSRKQSDPLIGIIDLKLVIEKMAAWKLVLFWTIIYGSLLWIGLLGICKIFIRNCHIPAMTAGIKLQSIDRKINIQVKRQRNCLIPFWRTGYLVYKSPKRSLEPYVDKDFCIKFRRISSEEFEIVNYEEFSDKNKFRLNNLQIGSGNNIFSKQSKIMVCDMSNVWHEIELDIGKRQGI